MAIWKRIIFVPLLLLFTYVKADHLFKTISLGDRGAGAAIHCLEKDQQGNVWIGSSQGLFCYDGYLSPLRIPEVSKPIQTICIGNQGMLWVGTTSDINLLDPKSKELLSSLSMKGVEVLKWQEPNVLWVGTVEGLRKFLWDGHQLVEDKLEKMPGGLHQRITTLHQDRWGILWIGTRDGLFKHLSNQTSYEAVPIDLLPPVNVWDIQEDLQGTLWFAIRKHLFKYRPTQRVLQPVWSDSAAFRVKPNKCMGLLPNQRIAVGTLGNGLFFLENANANPAIQHIQAQLQKPFSLASNYLNCMESIPGGSLLIGSQKGLFRWDPWFNRFNHLFQGESGEGLSSPLISSFEEDLHGMLWVGTQESGLNRVNLSSGEVRHILNKTGNPYLLTGNKIRKAVTLSSDEILVLAIEDFFLFRPSTGEFKKLTPYSSLKKKASHHPGRISILNNGNTSPLFFFKNYVCRPIIKGKNLYLNWKSMGKIGEDLSHLCLTPDGTSFCGLEGGNTLYFGRLEGEGKIGRFKLDITEKITGLTPLPGNRLLISTPNEILIWDGTTTQTLFNGFSSQPAQGICFELPNHIWWTTSDSLFLGDLKNQKYIGFGEADGMLLKGFNGVNRLSHDGERLFVGSNEGLLWMDTKDFTLPENPPKIGCVKIEVEESPKIVVPGENLNIKGSQITCSFLPQETGPHHHWQFHYLLSGENQKSKVQYSWGKPANLTVQYGSYELKGYFKNKCSNEVIEVPLLSISRLRPFWHYLIMVFSAILVLLFLFLSQRNRLKKRKPKEQKPVEDLELQSEYEAICKAFHVLLEKEKLFLKPSLGLKEMAEKLQVPTLVLKQVLFQCEGRTFNEVVNRLRVEEVKRLLADPNSENLTLLAIAFDSGFNSKATFNRVFKEVTGMTPTEYKEQFHPKN